MTASPAPAGAISMDELVSLCKRRGFIYPASEIYGGINGFWDYGPLGILLKNNLRDRWWRDMVLAPPPGPDGEELSIVGLDSSIVQNPKTWVASGHVGGFSDPMVDCRETKSRYRADHIIVYKLDGCERMYAFVENNDESADRALKMLGKYAKRDVAAGDVETIALTDMDVADYAHVVGPDTKEAGTLTEPREFNLMFETYVGAMQSDDSKAFLRPETAQGIFLNYKNVLDTMRVRVPFGIAQIGKAFRNEVTPRNFIFRSREFEQMEMEWFCHPDDAEKWYEFWCQTRFDWWKGLGIDASRLIMREHDKDELAHYSKEGAGTSDVEYEYPFTSPGHGELEGVAHRGNYDLTQHAKRENAGAKLEYFDQERNERYMPHVIEPAAGLSRGVLVLLCEAFTPDESRASKVYMKFPPSLAPIKAGVFPLVKKDGLPEIAQKLTRELRARFGHTGLIECDEKQSIGKRYARMDEAGCPFCFTIDGDTKDDHAVTVRHRDTQEQERIGLDAVAHWLGERLV